MVICISVIDEVPVQVVDLGYVYADIHGTLLWGFATEKEPKNAFPVYQSIPPVHVG